MHQKLLKQIERAVAGLSDGGIDEVSRAELQRLRSALDTTNN